MIVRCLDTVGMIVDTAWHQLVWILKVSVILGVLAGVAYVANEGMPFREWVRVEIVISPGPKGPVGSAATK